MEQRLRYNSLRLIKNPKIEDLQYLSIHDRRSGKPIQINSIFLSLLKKERLKDNPSFLAIESISDNCLCFCAVEKFNSNFTLNSIEISQICIELDHKFLIPENVSRNHEIYMQR